MPLRRPLVSVAGQLREIPTGDAVPIEAGGTGGVTAQAARAALGVAPGPDSSGAEPSAIDGSEVWATKKAESWVKLTVAKVAAYVTGIYTITLRSGVGAAALTLLAILRGIPVVPQQFGALGVSGSDDSTALQDFLDFIAVSGHGHIPPGVYGATNLVLPEAEFSLTGEKAEIRKIAGGSSAYLAASERWVSNVGFASLPVKIRGVKFNANNLAANALVMQSYFAELERVDTTGSTGDGLLFPETTADGTTVISGGQSNCEIVRCRSYGNTGRGFALLDAAHTRMKDWKMIGCFGYDNHAGNLHADNCAGAEVGGNHFYHVNDSAPTGTAYIGKTFGTLVANNIFEKTANGLPCLTVLGGSNPPQFVGNHFWSEVLANFAADCYVMQFTANHFYDTAHYKHNYNSSDRVIISTGNTFDGASATNIYQFGSGSFVGRYLSSNDYSKYEDAIYSGTQRSSGRKTTPQPVVYVEFPASASFTMTSTSGSTQVFTSPLTAQVDVTMPAGKMGWRFRFVRAASSTGAFNVSIAGGIAVLGPGQWADLDYDNTQWRKTAAGSL